MEIKVLNGAIFGLTVLSVDPKKEAAIIIDKDILLEAGIMEYQQLQVYNNTSGYRFLECVTAAEPGSGLVIINGPTAHLFECGDILTVEGYIILQPIEARNRLPTRLYVNSFNEIIKTHKDTRIDPYECVGV